MAPKLEIGCLNCTLLFAYSVEILIDLLCPSKLPAPNLILPTLRAFMAILNPPFLSPNKFSTGTIVSVKNTCLVDDE